MVKKKKRLFVNFFIVSVVFFTTDICVSQSLFSRTLNAFKEKNFIKVKKELENIDTISISLYNKATWYFYYADYNFKTDNQHLAYKFISKSKKVFYELEKINDVIDCDILMMNILSHQNNLEVDIDPILKEVKEFAYKNKDSTILRKTYHRIAVNFLNKNKRFKALEYFAKVINIAKSQKDSLVIGYTFDNIGTTFQNTTPRNIDSAIYYTKKSTKIYLKYKDYLSLAYNYNNQGQQHKMKNDYKTALKFLKKADSIPLSKNIPKSKLIFYQNISDTYNKLNDYKNESVFLKKMANLKDSISDTQQNIAISNIKEKYDNEKLRVDKLEDESKIKQKQDLLIGSLIFILLGTTIAFLQLKNSKRKRKLAEQQKEIQTQKNLTLLKEQELTTINAMVEGQEKERKRVAEDLHDNLGSVLATLKLHFENLKINKEKKKINQDELFNKTENLIDEAYLKVRRIAHAKNAGVIANQGLLVAVQMMAEKISSADKIKIEVIDFGLNKRLENSLEITVFRIIQELTTNILKHAEAKNATINMSQFDNNLNIIIEDDGKGFDIKKVNLRDGMGIQSIKTRIAHLNGTFEIDSIINKGASILINIPIT